MFLDPPCLAAHYKCTKVGALVPVVCSLIENVKWVKICFSWRECAKLPGRTKQTFVWPEYNLRNIKLYDILPKICASDVLFSFPYNQNLFGPPLENIHSGVLRYNLANRSINNCTNPKHLPDYREEWNKISQVLSKVGRNTLCVTPQRANEWTYDTDFW